MEAFWVIVVLKRCECKGEDCSGFSSYFVAHDTMCQDPFKAERFASLAQAIDQMQALKEANEELGPNKMELIMQPDKFYA